MNIGLDLDGVVFDIEAISRYAFIYYGEEYYSPVDWEMSNYPSYIKTLIFKSFGNEYMMIDMLPLLHSYSDIHSLLATWKSKGHNTYIVTSRSPNITLATKYKCNDYFGNVIEHLVVCDGSKIPAITEYKINVLVDDSPKNIQECLDNNIKAIMISSENQIYNHYMRGSVEWHPTLLDVKL